MAPLLVDSHVAQRLMNSLAGKISFSIRIELQHSSTKGARERGGRGGDGWVLYMSVPVPRAFRKHFSSLLIRNSRTYIVAMSLFCIKLKLHSFMVSGANL